MNNLTFFFIGLVLIYIPTCLSQNNDKQCFSLSLKPSYPCCKGNNVVYTDEDGDWGVENNKWCGIGNGNSKNLEDTCFSVDLGYSCCQSCKVIYTDEDGDWGVENNKWCGIKDNCTSNVEVKNPVQSDTDFDFTFLKMENNKKNMLYSPLSIEYALKMLEEGADNNTYAEINKVIGNIELPKYSSIDKILSLANGLYIRDVYYKNIKATYINKLKEEYEADVVEDEFKNAENANKWIEDKTLGIIKNMVSDELLQNPLLVILIINALAIDMEWASQFSFDSTYGEKFYLDDGQEMRVAMMFKNIKSSQIASYYIDDDITVLTMDLKDYDGVQFEFMAIMPKENLSAYVENITKEQINQLDNKLKFASDVVDGLDIRIPKFKFSYDLKLKEDLIDLGIKDAFDRDMADFSKMADATELPLYVSEALHKADIEFTEKGIKAAAVTLFGMMGGGMFPITQPIEIIINKPFMFIIRDKNTKCIWFTNSI